MKSIKEKAEECSLVREYVDSCGNFIRENSRVKQEQFTLGANYVLEQIENVLTNPRRYVNPDKSVEEGMVDALIKCVEQLKSNQ